MKIKLQELIGPQYVLNVEPLDKVKDVKLKIGKEFGIKQKVSLIWENEPLEDCVTLRESGIIDNSSVQMVLDLNAKMKLSIQTFKKGSIDIEVDYPSTPLDVVEALSRVTTAKSSDFYFGQTQLSDENLPLHFYGISDGDTLVQNYPGSFHIRLDDARIHGYVGFVKVAGTDTIKVLTEKVLKLINRSKAKDQCDIMEDEIVLFHVQKEQQVDIGETCVYNEVDRETMTVFQSDIRPRDSLTFIRYHGVPDNNYQWNVDIKITGDTEQTRRICGVYDRETVQSLRLKIQHQLHVPYEKQILSVKSEVNPSLRKELRSNIGISLEVKKGTIASSAFLPD